MLSPAKLLLFKRQLSVGIVLIASLLSWLVPAPAQSKDVASRLQDNSLLGYFPEAAGTQPTSLDINQVLGASDLDPIHVAKFEGDFEVYLDEEIAKGNIPASSKAWWHSNKNIFMKKAFMSNPGATLEVLKDAVGRANRSLTSEAAQQQADSHGFVYQNTVGQLPAGVQTDVGTVWDYVAVYGGWAVHVGVVVAIPVLGILLTAYTTGPLGALATASVQNWIRGSQEDLATASSKLRRNVLHMLKGFKEKQGTVKDLEQAAAVVKGVKSFAEKEQDYMNMYDYVHLTAEQALANSHHAMGQSKSAFESLSATIAPYMREGRANILDAQYRPMNFSTSMAVYNSQRMLAQGRVEKELERLEKQGVTPEEREALLLLHEKVFSQVHFVMPSVSPETLRANRVRMNDVLATLKRKIQSSHTHVQQHEIEALLQDHLTELMSRRQMATTMAAWWDHDIRFPELNREMDEDLVPISQTMKEAFGFADYLRMPGIQDGMREIHSQIKWDLKETSDMLEQKLAEIKEVKSEEPESVEVDSTPSRTARLRNCVKRFFNRGAKQDSPQLEALVPTPQE